MEKRLFIAMGLSLLVLLAFQKLNPPRKNPVASQRPAYSEATPTQPAQTVRGRTDFHGITPVSATGRELPEETTTNITTEAYELIFTDVGGNLKEITLNEYTKGDHKEVIYQEENPARQLFALQSGAIINLESAKYETSRGPGFLEYRVTEPERIEIVKKFEFHNSLNQIQLQVNIKNLSDRKMAMAYSITGPSTLERTNQVAGRSFAEADTLIDDKVWKIKRLKNTQEKTGNIMWTAMKNRYFTVMLKPFTAPFSVTLEQDTKKNLTIKLNSGSYELSPGETVSNKYLIYAGPLDEKRIEALGYEMQEVVNFGFFGGVSKMLLSVLSFFHQGVKNWGVAIILLTLLINVVMFPLTTKSFTSMHQMKKIQPHIQKLKELHKDNPQKLNKETMELYKTYNVNPLGGCLPMLLQMPIFISLYQGLMRSVELKGAHFLWIKDLAKPDAVHLPFVLPALGANINVLPLLMVGVMFLQQKISQGTTGSASATNEQAKQQKTMMMFMPLFFGFLFYKMPSGLVLYWLTNTILMTVEQGFISKKMD